MAISWSIMEGAPVPPGLWVPLSARYIDHITGHDGWVLKAKGNYDGQEWSWPPGDEDKDKRVAMSYNLEVEGSNSGFSGTAYIGSDQEIEDDGSPVEGHAYVEVDAARTQTSVVIGLASALAVFELSGGDISGTGLGRWFHQPELKDLLDLLHSKAPTSESLEEAIARLGRNLNVHTLSLR